MSKKIGMNGDTLKKKKKKKNHIKKKMPAPMKR